ncbi:hypothetical protein MNBD_GAMMA02-54 [hydrothermal vent metagenome]|uniref:Uncharacterized protein n=1 Tax=hydrothermal vent metagenome TaxID=652676 RepID=A0A3B0VX07_9ZZZZ
MNIDQQIKQALSDEVKDIKHNNEVIDGNPFKQMKASFSGQMGWMYILVMLFSVLFAIGMVYCGFQFYYAQETKALIGWGIGIIVLALFTQISKMWYWTEMGHNRVIREVKVLELQIAQMNEKLNR